jgi:hypothetical protein
LINEFARTLPQSVMVALKPVTGQVKHDERHDQSTDQREEYLYSTAGQASRDSMAMGSMRGLPIEHVRSAQPLLFDSNVGK